MALEIERKFLVEDHAWRALVESSSRIVQAYIALDGTTSTRVRIRDGRSATLTVKLGLSGKVRHEFEYPVPVADAQAMIRASRGRLVEKTRHLVGYDNYVWEVDVYEGELAGLVIAEIETETEDETPPLPKWLGREVTGDPAWSNAMLATRGLPAEAVS